MSKRKYFIILFVFAAFVTAYYLGVKPMFSKTGENFYYKDDFPSLNTDFWYVGEMQTNKNVEGSINISEGILSLEKNHMGEDVYLLSKPIKMGKKQILTIKREITIHPSKAYFSGGLVVFQTSSKKLAINSASDLPFGSSLFMLEYIKDPSGKSKRPGKNNIRILPNNWEKDKLHLLMKPIFDKKYKEEFTYNAYTGEVRYKMGEKEHSIKTQPLEKQYIRIWMHAYGKSAKQRIEMDNIQIRIQNLEDADIN